MGSVVVGNAQRAEKDSTPDGDTRVSCEDGVKATVNNDAAFGRRVGS